MSRHRLTVVLSQAQSKHPAKRALEEAIVAALIMEPGLEVSVVPYLYDLGPDHTGRLFLSSVHGDMVLLSWLYPRAAFWVLDRDGIKGLWGETQVEAQTDEDEEEGQEPEPPRGIGSVDAPDRFIYCLDLRDCTSHTTCVEEVRRIAEESRQRYEAKQVARSSLVQLGVLPKNGDALESKPHFSAASLLQPGGRRWYPVIDYSRCTNCMECIDFCLFGVYGVDRLDRILVENQDYCKKGCPACSRVCPENAIMFPEYKSSAIAGAPVGAIAGLKIDLTKLFGGGDKADPLTAAVAERDAELMKDGRQAVGATVGMPRRQSGKMEGPKDDLDKLMDSLDALDI